MAQSMEPLYLAPPPEVIIILLLIVNGVGHEAGSNSDSPSKEEGSNDGRVLSSDEHGLQGIEHTDSRDGEASVDALDTVRLQGLDVDIDQSVELTLSTHGLDGVLEGKVQGLGGEVPQHVGEVSSPEGDNTLGGHHPLGAVKNTGVGLVQTTLLDHLVLVLDEQLDSL